MSKDTFGSPSAGDDVALDESIIEEASREHADFWQEIIDSRRRAIGSKRVSGKDQMMEWELLRETPEMLAEFYASQGANLEEMVNHAFERERKRS